VTTVQVEVWDDVGAFRRAVTPWLLAHEAMNCLPLGLLATLADRPEVYPERPYLALVRADGEPALMALRTPPHQLVVSWVTRVEEPVLTALVDDLWHRDPDTPGVMGPDSVAHALTAGLARRRGGRARRIMAERVYELTAVIPPPPTAGRMRPATEADRDVLARWGVAFAREATPEDGNPEEAGRRLVMGRIPPAPDRGLVVWEDHGQVVAMAGYAGPTPTGIRIAPVYTPPPERRRGYASALVAALSQWLLDQGRARCFLFTDLSNPTSNKIYQAVGYRPVGDVGVYRVVLPGAEDATGSQ
jgi:predicted GNAT family acetyltransferase